MAKKNKKSKSIKKKQLQAELLALGERVEQLEQRLEGLAAADAPTNAHPEPAAEAGEAGHDGLDQWSVVQLRDLAKTRGLTGVSRLTKPQLIERLNA